MTDVERKTLLVNQRMAEMLGYPPDEMIGTTPSAFLDPDQESLRRRPVEGLPQGRRFSRSSSFGATMVQFYG